MTYLRFDLILRSPAIVSTISGDPNSPSTQSFVPGSVIRGAVATRLIADGEDAESALFRRLILSGAVRYLHAYPHIAGTRAMPVPLSWKTSKGDPSCAQDLAGYSGDLDESTDAEDFGDKWPQDALASVAGAFVAPTIASGRRTLKDVRVNARLHQQRDRVKGRPWTDKQENAHGAIYTYEYLEPDQTFTGLIQVTEAAASDIDRLKALLTEPILVGRARRAGYGGEAVISAVRQETGEYLNATGRLDADVIANGRFRVLLTSAYVGRHPLTGQNDALAIEQELADLLGSNIEIERRRWAFEVLGGFNRKWGLETPQVVALRGGSVLVLRARGGPLGLDVLRRVEHEGLGERRAEGFGRVLFLHYDDEGDLIRLGYDAAGHGTASLPSDSGVSAHSGFLEERLVLGAARAELDRVARLDIVCHASRLPTNSLLARLRAPLRGRLDEESAGRCLQTIVLWCGTGDTALMDAARNKLKACSVRIGGLERDLLSWLFELADSARIETGWARLVRAVGSQSSVTGLATRRHLTTKGAAQCILEANSALLRVHLIDAVLAAMVRKNQGES